MHEYILSQIRETLHSAEPNSIITHLPPSYIKQLLEAFDLVRGKELFAQDDAAKLSKAREKIAKLDAEADRLAMAINGYMNHITELEAQLDAAASWLNDKSDKITELEAELDYLRYFHTHADFGPAHTDVVMAIQRQYEQSGKQVPEGWKYE